MRVLYLTDSLSDLDGVGRYAVRLISALEQIEPALEVRVLLARKHRPTSSAVPSRWNVEVALPPDYFFHMSPPRFWASLGIATWRAARAARGCDLVHAIKDYPHNLVALLAARRAGLPCVATGHGTYTVQPLLSPHHHRLARWTYGRFAAMVAVSGFTSARLLDVLGPEHALASRLRVVPNAVSAEHYAARREIGPRPWHAVPFTLSIGELKERKGHHLALEAWCGVAARHRDLHHYVVGKASDPEYAARLAAIARRARVEERVHLLGNVSEDEKVDLLQRALAFVHTPVTAGDGGFEGFGIVYLEAAAAGAPSIGTKGSGAEDAVADGVSGLLVEPDVAAVEDALSRLLGDPPLRARLGASARAYAARRTWRDNAREVLAIYREALAGGRAADGRPR
jgi:phosphatidylinositol alpha-1,6-mannosyltransferase